MWKMLLHLNINDYDYDDDDNDDDDVYRVHTFPKLYTTFVKQHRSRSAGF